MSLADLIIGAHYNDLGGQTFDLDFVRDGGSATGGTQGAPSIVAGGKFNAGAELIGTDGLVYSGSGLVDAMVQTGAVSLWFKPNYSGTPSTTQVLYLSTQSGGTNNAIVIQHLDNGDLTTVILSSSAATIVDISSAWSPTVGVWYHFELNFDVTGGATRLFLDGSSFITSPNTGTRSGTADKVYLGNNPVVSELPDGVWDELLVYDAVQHASAFTPPVAETNLNFLLVNPSFEIADNLTGNFPEDWTIGGAAASWDWALFAALETLEGFEHSWNGNEGRLAAFGLGDTVDAQFDVSLETVEDFEEEWNSNEDRIVFFIAANLTDANFDSGTPETVEDFEEEWNSNEDRITAFVPATHLTDAEFDVANDDFEDFEEEWNSNEDRIVAFVPATHLTDALFATESGTQDSEDFDNTNLDLEVKQSVDTGAITAIDPTLPSRVTVSLPSFVAVFDVQARRAGSGIFETQATISGSDVPAEIELAAGYDAWRTDTTFYVSGAPNATVLWGKL